MKLKTFILRRLGYSVFVLMGLSILVFLIVRAMPSDPARLALGARAPEWAIQRLRQ
ncbi:MAG: ABC transporter permease, partial [bacterium]